MKGLLFIPCLLVGLLPAAAQGQEKNAAVWRDPFWPVGYVPEAQRDKPSQAPVKVQPMIAPRRVAEPPKPVIDWGKARRHLRISGYAEGNGIRSCFINGKLYSEGESVVLDQDGFRYTWRLVKIDREPARNEFEEVSAQPVPPARPER
ncbi:MAG: hypothetical protein GX590_00855 [Lentisphaerae bacterium]|nr:hypothetical protein [Lentisphaerota bacterium]